MAQRQIGVTFSGKNSELYEWVRTQARKRPMPIVWFIIEAIECYRLVTQLAGQDWREWLEAADIALFIINNQYENIESAMTEHEALFRESEE